MEPIATPISRRNMLRIAGGTAGVTGLVGASLLSGSGLLVPTYAAPSKRVRAELDRTSYRAGQRMTLRIHEELKQGREIRVKDSTGLRWKRVSRSGTRQVWTARADWPGTATVTVVAVRADGRPFRDREFRDRVVYRVKGGGAPLIGMSAPAGVWAQRLSEVGPGVAARRIFADLAKGPTSEIRRVEEAHAAGMLPVISYKVGGDIEGAVNGRYNAVAEQAAAKLASYGLPTAVAFWHEPHNDMTTDQYVAASKQLLPVFKRGELRVGPILNGFLLDTERLRATWDKYCPDDLFEIWDWVGLDTYQMGSLSAPGKRNPADRIYALSAYVKARGYADKPLGVGEYNAFSAEAIAATGEALLSTPNVWFGCVWNSKLERDYVLTGDRLAAFQQTLADSRSAEPRQH